ncbi:MAG: class I tRNA ligase family protein [Phycisphaerales bacterium]
MGGALGTPALRAGVSEAPAERIEATAHLNGNIDVPITADGFVGRDPYPPGIYGSASDLLVKRRFLPHLELPGATYFVSWKTLDDRVLNPEEQAIALDALRHFDGQHGRVYAAVVMSNHVHWLVRPYDGHRLGDLISGAKRFSARAMNMRTGAAGSVWVPECFDHIVRDDAFFGEFFRYIVRNPVEAGAAASPAEYPWLFVHPDVRTRDGLRFAAIRGKGESARPDGAPAQSPARRAGVPKASVDLYVGGVEHAVLHLLYARFWHKVLFDLGHVSTPEPFGRLFNQGYIQDYAFKNEAGFYVDAFKVTCADGSLFFDDKSKPGPYFFEGKPVSREYGKMGKSLKNAVAPDEVFADFGCDTLRVYEMSMGPLEASKPWNTRDIAGAHRFLQRVWRNLVDEKTGGVRVSDGPPSDAALVKLLHKTIAGVRKDMETLGFNTAVAKLIEFNNELTKRCGPDAGASKDGGQDVRPTKASPAVSRGIAEPLVLMLAPLAPHMAEELWQKLGHGTSLAFEPFPVADSALAADDEIEIPVQVLGKLRGKVVVPAGSDAATIEAAAKADPKIAEQLAGKTIKKVIVVPGKLVNFVVG